MRPSILGLFLLLPLASCALPQTGALPEAGPLEAVETLDLERSPGAWYEIAGYPNSFEVGLVGGTAEDRKRKDGQIEVIHTGRRDPPDGERSELAAAAWLPDLDQPAKSLVEFLWPFRADHRVIALDDDHGWAVVAEPAQR